jgi:hypothetical protein
MPWWGWLLIGIGAVLFLVVVVPLKMRILKKMMGKKEEETIEE